MRGRSRNAASVYVLLESRDGDQNEVLQVDFNAITDLSDVVISHYRWVWLDVEVESIMGELRCRELSSG